MIADDKGLLVSRCTAFAEALTDILDGVNHYDELQYFTGFSEEKCHMIFEVREDALKFIKGE